MSREKLKLRHSHFRFYCFALIVFVAAILRFNSLKERGIFYYDEGGYFLQTKFLSEGFQLLCHQRSEVLNHDFNLEKLKTKTEGVPLITGKPGYASILFLFSLIFGLGEYTLFLASAVFGIINLLLIFKIAEDFYNNRVALLSCAIAAVSSYHVFYSTVGLPEMVGLTFYLFGFWAFYRSLKQPQGFAYIIFSGLAIGYAFTCNQWRWVLMPLFVLLFELIRLLRKLIFLRKFFSRITTFILFFLIPIFIFQIPYQILLWIKGSLPFRTYFQQLMERFACRQGMAFSIKDSGIFLKYFWLIEGSLFTVVLISGIIVLAINTFRRKKDEDLLIFIVLVIPLIIFSLYRYGNEALSRTISMVIPFTALVIGKTIDEMSKITIRFLPMKHNIISALLIFAILLFGALHSLYIPQAQAGYSRAANYLADRGYRKAFILENEPVFRAYAGRIAYEPYNRPSSLEELFSKYKDSGADRLIVDYNVLHSKYGMQYIRKLVAGLKPEAVFPNPKAGHFIYLTEVYAYKTIKEILNDPEARYIKIYNLGDWKKEINGRKLK